MLWSGALNVIKPGIFSIVGAGGKTSLLHSLCREWKEEGNPFLLTSTTKMFLNQVEDFNPVLSQRYETGIEEVKRAITTHGLAAWFEKVRADKVVGISPHWVDRAVSSGAISTAFVEADGAQQRLIKAPGRHEPRVPLETTLTLGVLNINAIGLPLSERIVHRLEIVESILNKRRGQGIEARDLAVLAGAKTGIFSGCPGELVLVITGGTEKNFGVWHEIVGYLPGCNEAGISRIVLAQGVGSYMKPVLQRGVAD